ncbi:MAG: Ku protein [bacterium]|nr:Ku protein [bacterium]
MHSIWTGSLSFGLINIPIKIYSGTAGTTVEFNMLHKTDNSPIRYAKVCRRDGKELTQDDIVKGYEHKDGDYVVLTNEDLKKLNAERSQVIDVVGFVKESEIDTIYFEKPYYLEPGKGADKAYFVLRESLKKSKKVGVAKFVIHSREHLGIIKPHEEILVLEQIRYEDQIATWDKLEIPKHPNLRTKELAIASSFIDHLTEHFDPSDYKDTFHIKLRALIKLKLKGHVPKPVKEKVISPTKSGDLMLMLQESLEKAKKNPRAFQ